MLACRPVVVANVQGLAEIVCDDTIGSLVEPDDAGALAAAVQALIDNWAQARERAFRARDDAQRRFGAERYRSELAAALLRASGLPAGNLSPSTVFAASASGPGSGRRPVQDGQVQ
jgi:glycosyltransferase involved in cell wall biosynthesis